MKINKSLIVGIIIFIVLAALATRTLMANKKSVEEKIYIPDVDAPVLVEVIKPTLFTFEDEFSYLGSFEPNRQNIISSEGNGRVISMNLAEGDRVGVGSIIAKLDDELIKLQIESLEVSMEGQEKDEVRYSSLANQNASPAVQAEKTQLGIKASKVQMKQLKKQLSTTIVKAPFSGVITKKMVDLGSVIGAGSPVVEITDIAKLKLTVNVPERDIYRFKVNQPIVVSSEQIKKSINGKITQIAVQADKSHNFKVHITIDNPSNNLRAGMYGTATMKSDQKITSLSIPRRALVGSLKNPQVYVVRNGKAKLVSFSLGLTEGDVLEVRDGLTSNDQVVVRGQINLKDNKNVKIAQ
ncbi:MAG: efflux RND transporter periplasmic adaptor subunit [Flavobacteriia bacterium]|nr:efflux RND transporter periplasmic adaptor subunit [Flavobacteriia bacterium]